METCANRILILYVFLIFFFFSRVDTVGNLLACYQRLRLYQYIVINKEGIYEYILRDGAREEPMVLRLVCSVTLDSVYTYFVLFLLN